MVWQSNLIFGLTAPVFPIAFLLGRRLQKDTSQTALSPKNTRIYQGMIAYSLAMFLATGIQESRRNTMVKELATKYLHRSTNDHLRVLAGESVANSNAPYSGYQPMQMTQNDMNAQQQAFMQQQTDAIERQVQMLEQHQQQAYPSMQQQSQQRQQQPLNSMLSNDFQQGRT